MLAALDGVEEVATVVLGVGTGQALCLFTGHGVEAVLVDEVVLHPEALALGVDPGVGVGAVAVHAAPGGRQAAVAHEVGDLVGRLGVLGPEVPLHVRVAQAGVRQTLLGADEVRELHGVTDEEHRGVVAHDVEVALFGVELQRETAHIAPGVRGSELSGDSGEAQQGLSGPAGLEDVCLGVLGDVVGHLEGAECTGALGMRPALRNVHPVEVSQCLDEVMVMQDDGAVIPHGQGEAVADGWDACLGGGTSRIRCVGCAQG